MRVADLCPDTPPYDHLIASLGTPQPLARSLRSRSMARSARPQSLSSMGSPFRILVTSSSALSANTHSSHDPRDGGEPMGVQVATQVPSPCRHIAQVGKSRCAVSVSKVLPVGFAVMASQPATAGLRLP